MQSELMVVDASFVQSPRDDDVLGPHPDCDAKAFTGWKDAYRKQDRINRTDCWRNMMHRSVTQIKLEMCVTYSIQHTVVVRCQSCKFERR